MNNKSRGMLVAGVFAGMIALALGFAGLLVEPMHVGSLWGSIAFAVLGILLTLASRKKLR